MNKIRVVNQIVSVLLVWPLASGAVQAADKPLKVFILVGQSNMEGHAAVSTFDYIGKDLVTARLLKEMRNPDGTLPAARPRSDRFGAPGAKANS